MTSHYQSYLKAIGGQEKVRSVSTPTSSGTSPIARKPTNRSVSPVVSSPYQNLNGPQTPSTQPRSNVSITPVSTAPSSVANVPQQSRTPASPLKSHPPDVFPVRSNSPESRGFTSEQTSAALTSVVSLLHSAVTEHDKSPFAAILLAPDNSTTLLSHFSISTTRRAETELARLAADQYTSTYLAKCTIVSAWEPCPMSAGAIYLAGIGRVVYAGSESKLKDVLSGEDFMSIPCRTILGSGSREVEVVGPIAEWEAKVVAEASGWSKYQNGHDSLSKAASIRSNATGSGTPGHGQGERTSVVTTWTHEDSVLSSIGEDGEYKADLDIDWMK